MATLVRLNAQTVIYSSSILSYLWSESEERFPTVVLCTPLWLPVEAVNEGGMVWEAAEQTEDSVVWDWCVWVCARVCVGSNRAERRVSGSYLYSSGFGYPWIHLGDWEACIKRKWERGYCTNVAAATTPFNRATQWAVTLGHFWPKLSSSVATALLISFASLFDANLMHLLN